MIDSNMKQVSFHFDDEWKIFEIFLGRESCLDIESTPKFNRNNEAKCLVRIEFDGGSLQSADNTLCFVSIFSLRLE